VAVSRTRRGGGVKRSENEADQRVPSGTEAKNKWSFEYLYFSNKVLGVGKEILTF
jgi:hypothetical protein